MIKEKMFQGLPRPLPLPKTFVTRMLMHILLAVANLLVFLLSCWSWLWLRVLWLVWLLLLQRSSFYAVVCVSVFIVFVVYVISFQIGSIWTIEVVKSIIILSTPLMGGRLGQIFDTCIVSLTVWLRGIIFSIIIYLTDAKFTEVDLTPYPMGESLRRNFGSGRLSSFTCSHDIWHDRPNRSRSGMHAWALVALLSHCRRYALSGVLC